MASTNTGSNHFAGNSVTQTRFFTSGYLFGLSASWMFAFMVVQAFTYFRQGYKKDPKPLKSIVCIVIRLQLMETGLTSYTVYAVDAAGWGDPEILHTAPVYVCADTHPVIMSLSKHTSHIINLNHVHL